MTPTQSRHQNPDGTWNGPSFFAEMTGLSEAEIKWTFDRMKELIRDEGRPKEEAIRIVREEVKHKPWL